MAVRHDASPKALVAAQKREAAKPGRQKSVGRGSGLTPRVREAIDILVFGDDLGTTKRMKEAADRANISVAGLRAAMLKPSVDRYYKQQLQAKRDGLKAVALNTVEAVMTDPALAKTPAGARAMMDAAKTILHEPVGASIQVNTQINNTLNVTPGYVIDLTPEDDEERQQIKQSAPSIDHAPDELAVYTSR